MKTETNVNQRAVEPRGETLSWSIQHLLDKSSIDQKAGYVLKCLCLREKQELNVKPKGGGLKAESKEPLPGEPGKLLSDT
jgi:hypothetical protein